MTSVQHSETPPRVGPGRRLSTFFFRHPRTRLGVLLALPVAWLVVVYFGSLVVLLVSAFWDTDPFTAEIVPAARLEPLDLTERGAVVARRGRARVANLPFSIAEREVAVLEQRLGWPAEELRGETVDAQGPGNVVTVEVESERVTEVFTSFGERGLPAETVAERAVGLDRRVDAHGPHGGEQLDGEAILHQRLAAAQGEAARHDFQAVAVLAQLLRGAGQGDGDAVAERPGVRVVAVEAPEHAAGRPRHDAHARSIDRRAGRERMEEAHVAGLERRSHVRLRNGLAEVDAKLVRAPGFERRPLDGFLFRHRNLTHGTFD